MRGPTPSCAVDIYIKHYIFIHVKHLAIFFWEKNHKNTDNGEYLLVMAL